MVAHKKHVNNKTIFSGIYMQQKSLFDPQNILDNISYENIFDKKFDEKYVSEELSEYFIRFNSDDNSFN